MPWDKVHEEAERLEHVISEDLEEAMARALGDPTVDPHGDPIPARDGTLLPVSTQTLVDAPENTSLQVTRVLCQTPGILRYLGDLGIYPGTRVVIRERAPFEGPVLVEVSGQVHAISYKIGGEICVEVA